MWRSAKYIAAVSGLLVVFALTWSAPASASPGVTVGGDGPVGVPPKPSFDGFRERP